VTTTASWRCPQMPDDQSDWIVLDPESRALAALLDSVAPAPLPVLLLGETGSGKEMAAERLHRGSPRAPRPLVRINCAALSDSIVDSELFGHERGAFTSAHAQRAGLFEAADGGTLFLDEVAELTPRTQAKLLRVLESGEIVRVGSTQTRAVDVRVVAATNADLEQMVAAGSFREDLLFRLNAITVRIPPLRARPTEVIPLAELFAARLARQLQRPLPRLSPGAVAALLAHHWPGNVRELRHVMERALVVSRSPMLQAEDLGLPAAREVDQPEAGIRGQMRSFEKERILLALERARHNQTRAAQLLGMSRRTLTNKLNAHRIARPRKKVPH
jgi:two-component system response regulator AtoC